MGCELWSSTSVATALFPFHSKTRSHIERKKTHCVFSFPTYKKSKLQSRENLAVVTIGSHQHPAEPLEMLWQLISCERAQDLVKPSESSKAELSYKRLSPVHHIQSN